MATACLRIARTWAMWFVAPNERVNAWPGTRALPTGLATCNADVETPPAELLFVAGNDDCPPGRELKAGVMGVLEEGGVGGAEKILLSRWTTWEGG